MKKSKMVCTLVLVIVLCLSVFANASAWGKNSPPSSSNIASGSSETRVMDNFNNGNGMYESDTTTKCYSGASKFTAQAFNVYTVNHSTKKITLKFTANYWNDNKGDWYKTENAKGETLKSTYVNKKVVKRDTKAYTLKSKGSSYYHYGKIVKGYTSIGIAGSWSFKSN